MGFQGGIISKLKSRNSFREDNGSGVTGILGGNQPKRVEDFSGEREGKLMY